jgi:hypothetical protein
LVFLRADRVILHPAGAFFCFYKPLSRIFTQKGFDKNNLGEKKE